MKIITSMLAAASLMVAVNAMAADMPELAKKNNCVACHAIDKKRVGPAWKDVASKYKSVTTYTYKGKEYPLKDGLLQKVSQGGSGVWGSMPMAANDPAGKNQAEMKQLVEFILGLDK